jgi:hypothetical protein
VVGRNLREKSLEELKGLAKRSPERIPDVIHELSFRKTRAAKRYLDELNGRKPMGQSSSGQRNSSGNSSMGRPRPERVPATEKNHAHETRTRLGSASSVIDPPLRDLEQRFELLRATFTIEAEILARWGMTSSMPPEIEAQVFSSWRKSLKKNSDDDLGRSIVSLEEDMKRLAEERAAE